MFWVYIYNYFVLIIVQFHLKRSRIIKTNSTPVCSETHKSCQYCSSTYFKLDISSITKRLTYNNIIFSAQKECQTSEGIYRGTNVFNQSDSCKPERSCAVNLLQKSAPSEFSLFVIKLIS